MALPLYLARTAAEFSHRVQPQEKLAWMACHFSSYGLGLSNCPYELPPGSMLIVNDRIPLHGHDPKTVVQELECMAEELQAACILLDFQRPGCGETARMAQAITSALSVPVAVSELYAGALDCPVFLPPVPADVSVETHLAPWQGREIWLEAALEGITWTVTEQGSRPGPLPRIPDRGLENADLFCHYRVECFDDRAEFSIWRTRADLDALLEKANRLGVTQAVGLWQELRK